MPLVIVVAQLDGEMTVESKQGAGTTSSLILPQWIADDEENEGVEIARYVFEQPTSRP